MNKDLSNNKKEAASPNKKVNSRLILLLLFVFVLCAAVGIKFYLDSLEENKILQANLDETYAELDSISSQLDNKIAEIEALGGDVSELQLIRKNLEGEKESLKSSNNWAANEIKRYKDKVSGYEELLVLQDEKIKKLEAVNEQLLGENTNLKKEKNVLNDSILELRDSKEELAGKVAVASELKAENIQIYGVNSRGKERKDEFRARQIEKLKVSFNLAENKVAQPEGKDIILRVINPKGDVLFDVATGSGSFMVDGKEMFYTAKQEILFDNTQQQLSFVYDRGQEYEEGVYKITLYADDYTIGKGTFTVK